MSAPAIFMFSKSADLLRKSLLSHVWRVPDPDYHVIRL